MPRPRDRELERLRQATEAQGADQGYPWGGTFSGQVPDYERVNIQLTAADASTPVNYSWLEIVFLSDGSPVTMPGGRQGSPTNTPARERNGAVISTFPVYVEAKRRNLVAGIPILEFDAPAATITIPASTVTITDDKGHTIAGCSTIELQNSTAGGTAPNGTWAIDSASAVAPGLISMSTQTLGAGDKTLPANAAVAADLTVGGGISCNGTQVLASSGYVLINGGLTTGSPAANALDIGGGWRCTMNPYFSVAHWAGGTTPAVGQLLWISTVAGGLATIDVLPPGSNGQVLTMVGGVPTWV